MNQVEAIKKSIAGLHVPFFLKNHIVMCLPMFYCDFLCWFWINQITALFVRLVAMDLVIVDG